MVWVLREVQFSSGRVSLVEGEIVLLLVPRLCDEGALKGLLVEVGDDGLGDLYPKPIDCDVKVVNPPCLANSGKLEQV